jgi:hypothetical protein
MPIGQGDSEAKTLSTSLRRNWFVNPISLENILCQIKANPGHGHGIPLR